MCFIVYSIPSSCGMFVYREVTSIEASIQSSGRAVVSSRLMKSVVSLMNDGSVCMYGCSQVYEFGYVFGYAIATGYYRSDAHRVFVYFL